MNHRCARGGVKGVEIIGGAASASAAERAWRRIDRGRKRMPHEMWASSSVGDSISARKIIWA